MSSSTNRRSNSRSTYSGSRKKSSRSRRRRRPNPIPYILGGILIVILAVAAVILVKKPAPAKETTEESKAVETEAYSTDKIQHHAVIDLSSILSDGETLDVQGMTPEEISEAITDKYSWSLKLANGKADVGAVVKPTVDANATTEAATMGDADNPDGAAEGEEETLPQDINVSDAISVPDYIAAEIPALIRTIADADADYRLAHKTAETEAETEKKKKKSKETETQTEAETAEDAVVYTLEIRDLDAKLEEITEYASNMWYVEPHGGSIGKYDAASDTFVMENSKQGFKINRDKAKQDLAAAIAAHKYTETISVDGEVLSAESKVTVGDYKIIASYTTNTTSNSVRNKNVALACKALNGTIVRPGEEFSFNNTVGQRTEEKGYGAAAAYNNGEVVQEIGGGVCQVSTTLYNAILKAGLKITARRSHTFKPTYVTPGQDATVSWGGPDFRFANIAAFPEYSNSENYAIGIRASYSNQTVTVTIYGRPVLKEGYSYSLSSEQIREMEVVRELITPESGKSPEKGTKGSVWQTKLIIKKGDEVISSNVDHQAMYAGHTEYYLDETSSESESESESDEVGEIIDEPQGPGGPGAGPGAAPGSTTAAPTAAPTTAETTAADNGGPTPVDAPTSPAVNQDAPPIDMNAPGSGSGVISENGPGEIAPGSMGGPGM